MEYYQALYDYQAATATNLTLIQGETVLVLEKAGNGWWNGEASRGTGWFPESYVGKRKDMLPMGWQAHADDAGRIYYVNLITEESSWDKPTEHAFKIGSTPNPPPLNQDDEEDGKDDDDDDDVRSPTDAAPARTNSNYADSPIGSKVAKVEGRELAVNSIGRVTYVDNFWADGPAGSGFDVMVSKQRQGKEVLREIAEWMRERAAIEDRYAKELARLGKGPLGDMEEGTAKEAWAAIKSDTLKQAEIHAGFVRELQEHAERPLLDFKEQQKLKKKDVWHPSCQMENIIVKDRKNMASREADIERVRKVHQQRLKDVEAAERAAARGLNDRKDLSKLESSVKDVRRKAAAASDEYQKAVNEYLLVRKVWEEDLKTAFEDYQDVEIKRIEFIRAVLENYLNSARNMRDNIQQVRDTQSAEAVQPIVANISAEKDIELFVKARGTGPKKPMAGSVDQFK